MKNSGIAWVGEIPQDWEAMPLYCFYSERKNANILGKENNLLSLSYGKVIRKDINTSDGLLPNNYNGYNIVERDDIIIRPTDLQNDRRSLRTGLAKERGIITSAYIALKPKAGIQSRYFHYLLHTYDICKVFYNMGNGVRQGLNYDEFAKLIVLDPSYNEQQRIADFLDRECEKIERIQSDIQAQIDTLEQYKRSVITEAVTHGLNHNVTLQESGIAWVGKCPRHWEQIKGKYILSPLYRSVRPNDGVVTCFRDGQVTLRSNRREDGFTMADKEIGYQGIEAGDLVVHGMDGFAGAIGISDSRGKTSPVLNVLDTKQNKKYIMYYLRSMAYNDVFTALSTGIRVRSCDLRWNKLAELLYPLPPIDEQEAIVQYIDKQLEKTNAVIANKKSQRDMLDEYKKSLIYEYVTGKKEVVL
jgi:type I restriction enzyme S subunit